MNFSFDKILVSYKTTCDSKGGGKKREFYSRDGGFIAIISAIIISMLIVTLALSTNLSIFWGRFATLDREYHKRSVGLAEGCVDVALLKLANDITYTGGETQTIGSDQCTILAIPPVPPGSNITIQTTATFQKSVSAMTVVVANPSLTLVSWDEVP